MSFKDLGEATAAYAQLAAKLSAIENQPGQVVAMGSGLPAPQHRLTIPSKMLDIGADERSLVTGTSRDMSGVAAEVSEFLAKMKTVATYDKGQKAWRINDDARAYVPTVWVTAITMLNGLIEPKEKYDIIQSDIYKDPKSTAADKSADYWKMHSYFREFETNNIAEIAYRMASDEMKRSKMEWNKAQVKGLMSKPAM